MGADPTSTVEVAGIRAVSLERGAAAARRGADFPDVGKFRLVLPPRSATTWGLEITSSQGPARVACESVAVQGGRTQCGGRDGDLGDENSRPLRLARPLAAAGGPWPR